MSESKGAPAAPEASGEAGSAAPPLPPADGPAGSAGGAGGASGAAGAGVNGAGAGGGRTRMSTAGGASGRLGTAGMLTQTAPRGFQPRVKEGPLLRVYPPVVEFHGVEVGTVYSIVVSLQNSGQRSRRLKLVAPESSAFTLNWTPVGTVAPGLDVKAEVEFKATEARPYHDKLVVLCGEERVEVPLHAYMPAPDIQFDGFVNLGAVVVDNTSSALVEMRNEGHRTGKFKITWDPELPIKITPAKGKLAPRGAFVDMDADGVMEEDEFVVGAKGKSTETIKVELTSSDVGVFRALATVELEGQPNRVLDINATVVEQRLELVLPDGGGPMSELHFGTLFHGQQRSVTALLVNNGPVPLSFSLSLGDKEDSGGKDPFGDDGASTGLESDFCPITVLPLEGSLEPYAQVPITFSFRPEDLDKPPAFKTLQAKLPDPGPTEYDMVALVECPDTGQEIEVEVTAFASKPRVDLSQKSFKFGECPVGERRDAVLKIKNPGEALPLEWSCNKVANFRIEPNRGTLQPLQSQNVIVTFAPGQMGRFQNTLHMVVGGGILTLPLRVFGTSSSQGRKRTIPRGRDAPPVAFKPQLNIVAAPDGEVPEGTFVGQQKAPKSTFTRPLPWSELSQTDQDLAMPTEALYTFSVHEMEARSAHRQQYNNYLAKARKARERKAEAAVAAKTSVRWDDPVNLGMDSHAGLSEPKLEPPPAKEGLWLHRPVDEDGTPSGRPGGARKVALDETKLIKKKFKAKPETEAEKADCATLLSVQELSSVSAMPRVMNFGEVCVRSVNKRSFSVVNDLPQSVLVAVSPGCEELKDTTPQSQVVPAGGVAGFDITLCAKEAQELRQYVTYVINEAHAFKFQVIADVVPVSVEITPPSLLIPFPESSLEPALTEMVVLRNPGNADAVFKWAVPDRVAFIVEPASGTIPPFSSVEAHVTFRPQQGASNDAILAVLAEGADVSADPPQLHCVGENEEPRVAFAEKSLDFGNVAVGVARDRVATMKNTGSCPAVFWVQHRVSGVTVTPDRGRVLPGATQDFHVTLLASSPQVYDERRHVISVCVRGGRTTRLPISAATVVPDVVLQEDEYDFGQVTVGSTMRTRVTLENRGVIPAALVVDLSKHPQFSLAMPMTDDAASVGGESVFAPLDAHGEATDDEDEFEEGREVPKASRFRLTVAASSFMAFDLVFSPATARRHGFELPLSLMGMEPGDELRRTVSAEGVEPRLLLSKTDINFENKIVARDRIKKVPYSMDVTLTNAEDDPLTWETDTSSLHRGHVEGVYRLDPSSGSLQPGERATVRVSFLPGDSREYNAIVPLYLDGDKSRPYVELQLSGVGLFAQLTFDRREVVLPVTALGEVSTATFHVMNCGYDHLELRYKMPSESSPARVPLQVSFPDGQAVGIAKQKLPVRVSFSSKKAMAFTCNIDFLDEDGNKFSIPVTGMTDNSMLTSYSYVQRVAESHQFYTREHMPVQLMDTADIAVAELAIQKQKEKAARRARKAATGSGAASIRSSSKGGIESKAGETAAKAAAAGGAGGAAAASGARSGSRRGSEPDFGADDTPQPASVAERSVDILVRYLNANLLKSPISEFPADVIAAHGRPVFEMVDVLAGKSPPGRLHRVNPNPREQTIQLLGQYKDLLSFLKQHGALLHHVRPEQLLKKEQYAKVTTSRRGHFGAAYGQVFVGNVEPSKLLAMKREASRQWQTVSLDAWSSVAYQILKVFVMSRINIKSFSALPGLEPGAATNELPAIGAPQVEEEGSGEAEVKTEDAASASAARGRGRKGSAMEEKKDEQAQQKKKKKPKVDPTLSGSNIYSVPEAILLKWLTYHHNRMNPDAALRVTNFAEDCRDGVVLAMTILSHAPGLARRDRPLASINRAPTTEEELTENCKAVVAAVKAMGLELPLTAEELRGDAGDGLGGLSVSDTRSNAGSGTSADGRTTSMSGMAAGAVGSDVPVIRPVGSGNHRDMLIAALYLYQNLPQLIPKTQIDFESSLGHTVVKTIELRNPTKRPISYIVTLEGAPEFRISSNSLRIEPDGMVAFPIECKSRFSAPCEAQLAFRSKREGGASAATMVFNLRSVVTTRPAVETKSLTSPCYEPNVVDVAVRNPFDEDAVFRVTLVQSRTETTARKPGKRKGKKGKGARGPPRRGGSASSSSAARRGGPAAPVIPKPEVKLPDPFCLLRRDEIKIPAGGVQRLPIQFLPFEEGDYRCLVVCVDEEHGEFVYEILGEATLPVLLDRFKYKAELKASMSRDLVLPFRNPGIAKAERIVSERRAPAGGGRASRLASRVKAPPSRGRGGASLQMQRPTVFNVEINSPYFEAPSEIELTPDGQVKAAGAGAKESGGLQTPRGGDQPNTLPLTFRPKAAGVYQAKLILRHKHDVRVYELDFTCMAPGVDRVLEFVAPARQKVTQEIPVVNGTDDDWTLTAQFSGPDAFKGASSLRVIRRSTANYQLTFEPEWAGDVKGELLLANRATGEDMKFELKGIGEDPLAEDHVVINCQARDRLTHVFTVRNPTDEPVSFTVESDLPHVSGASSLMVEERDEADYELVIHPQLGGTYSGSVSFIAPDGHFQWYTVEIQASAPEPEDKLEINSFVRRAVSVEIALANPLAEVVDFEVTLEGEGLIGDPVFSLAANEEATYELLYSPLTPGSQIGSITFVNEQVGEFWYELALSAEPAPPTSLDAMTAAVGGAPARQKIKLENPTGDEVVIKHSIDNRRNFAVTPAAITLPPYSAEDCTLEYTPSSIGEEEVASITFSSPALGEWVYNVVGAGEAPGMMPEVVVTAPAGQQTSKSVTFRNPFAKPMSVLLTLAVGDEVVGGGRFTADTKKSARTARSKGTAAASTERRPAPIMQLLKKAKNVVPPFAGLNIPFAFAPPQIDETNGTLIVEAPEQQLAWTYPLRGIAEAPPSDQVLEFEARSRESVTERVTLVLPGLPPDSITSPEAFTHEVDVPEEYKMLVGRSVVVEPVTSTISSASDPLEFDITFEPLRPFSCNCQFIVNKASGGRWRYEMRLTATEPEPDDIITVEALLHHTSSVAFNLTNQFQTYAPFKASFSLESPSELTVHPEEGVLPPVGTEGTTFVVSFTPREYGKTLVGKLIIETEDMRWSYEVRGTHPHYAAPSVGSRIDHKLDKGVAKMLHRSGEPRNIMKANMNVARNAAKGMKTMAQMPGGTLGGGRTHGGATGGAGGPRRTARK